MKKNKYRVFDVNNGVSIVEATNAIEALKKLGYYNITSQCEKGNIHIIKLNGNKMNYVFSALKKGGINEQQTK